MTTHRELRAAQIRYDNQEDDTGFPVDEDGNLVKCPLHDTELDNGKCMDCDAESRELIELLGE